MRHIIKKHEVREPKSLTEPVLLILTSLADHPRHGYALIKDIEKLSDGRVQLSTGTLFGALRRLLENGWIERFEQEDTSRCKQVEELTPEGLRQLQSELERMRQLTRAATARLKMREASTDYEASIQNISPAPPGGLHRFVCGRDVGCFRGS